MNFGRVVALSGICACLLLACGDDGDADESAPPDSVADEGTDDADASGDDADADTGGSGGAVSSALTEGHNGGLAGPAPESPTPNADGIAMLIEIGDIYYDIAALEGPELYCSSANAGEVNFWGSAELPNGSSLDFNALFGNGQRLITVHDANLRFQAGLPDDGDEMLFSADPGVSEVTEFEFDGTDATATATFINSDESLTDGIPGSMIAVCA